MSEVDDRVGLGLEDAVAVCVILAFEDKISSALQSAKRIAKSRHALNNIISYCCIQTHEITSFLLVFILSHFTYSFEVALYFFFANT